MARYKHIDTGPHLLLVDLVRQLRPGTFGHALGHLIDHELDLYHFDARFNNDSSGNMQVSRLRGLLRRAASRRG